MRALPKGMSLRNRLVESGNMCGALGFYQRDELTASQDRSPYRVEGSGQNNRKHSTKV